MFRDGWVKYGFGPDLEPMSKSLPFVIDYRDATPHPKLTHPLKIAQEVCRQMYDSLPKPLTLMVSGGVDSQAMTYAFVTAGVPVRLVMARYQPRGINDHDIVATFYREHGLSLDFIEFDVLKFHEEEILDWGIRYQNNSPHIITHMKIASMLDSGTVISAGCVVNREPIGTMSYSVFGMERYARISGQNVIGYFFNYDPHLLWAMNDLKPIQSGIYETKCDLYRQAGFPVVPQPNKLHGFEKVKDLYDERRVDPQRRLQFVGQPSQRPYDLLFRYPLVKSVPYSQDAMTLHPRDKYTHALHHRLPRRHF